YYSSQLSLIWLHEVENETDVAQQRLNQFREWASEKKSSRMLNEITSLHARRLCRQGNVELAQQTLNEVSIDKFAEPFLAEVPLLTKAWVLISDDQEGSWHEAEALLDERWAIAVETWQSLPSQIKILALKALLYQRQGRLNEALTFLEQAIKLAKPGGFVRTFVDLGTPIATLLYQLLIRGLEPIYLGQILAAFPKTQQSKELAPEVPEEVPAQLIVPLTRRETDILLLIAQGLPNKQVAQQLSISSLTVKRHTINIYQKLSVSNRHDAVQTAKALGIAPS
ncbi:MAG: LuxR C-terminal-related transcriptional regulator, partial [Chloroflexota bacterium]